MRRSGRFCCEKELEAQVLHTPAGYYVGTFCPNCGPYSRDTDYMTKEDAERWLNDMFDDEPEFDGAGFTMSDDDPDGKRTSLGDEMENQP